MMNTDETTPRRSDIFPEEDDYNDDDEYGSGGPGCLAWAIVGLFGLMIALGIVLTAAWAGFNDGVSLARQTEVAVTQQNILRQCEFLPDDIAAGRVELVQQRFDAITDNSGVAACAMQYIAPATQLFIDSQATATPSPTLTPPPSATPTLTPEPLITQAPAAATEIIVPTEASSIVGGFDLDALYAEAQAARVNGDFNEMIRTLDAIIALDPNYRRAEVNNALFTALTQEALRNYRNDGSLSEAVFLTERAREFGDVGELNFEENVALLYLSAQDYVGVDYLQAIRLLTQVRSFSADYRDTNRTLYEQLVEYGDLLAISDPCAAVTQYTSALTLFTGADVQAKLTTAQQSCQGITTIGTPDPNAPAGAQPTWTPTQGIAPIGQPGT